MIRFLKMCNRMYLWARQPIGDRLLRGRKDHVEERHHEYLPDLEAAEKAQLPGKLKIFFGYAAGVGKNIPCWRPRTKRKKRELTRSSVMWNGIRCPDTLALLEGLEELPCKEINYRGIHLREFDLDAALRRTPAADPGG